MKIEDRILSGLVNDEEYVRKVIPFLRPEYFPTRLKKEVFTIVRDYFNRYNTVPQKDAVDLAIEGLSVSQDEYKTLETISTDMYASPPAKNTTWLIEETEKFCQGRAIYNAIQESIEIMDGKSKSGKPLSALPDLLKDALGVSFETNVGHDYYEDQKERYEFYHSDSIRLPFDIELLNKITGGGLTPKTLNLVMAPPGGGKSIFLCHCATHYLRLGKNVLYITLEMAEERIAERIDANLLGYRIDELKNLKEAAFAKKIEDCKAKYKGKLIIKEFPPDVGNSLQFRHLIEELKVKKKFMPDVIVIDYLNICSSSRFKNNSNANTYSIVKAVSEELRSIGIQCDVPILSAIQLNRTGIASTDPGMSDVADSIGTQYTADLALSIITTPELERQGQVVFKQIKNRYNDTTTYKKFIVGLDKSRMKFHDLGEKAYMPSLEEEIKEKVKTKSAVADVEEYPQTSKSKDYSNWNFEE